MNNQRIPKHHLTQIQIPEKFIDDQLSTKNQLIRGCIIAGKYKLLDMIGQGSFGMLFKTQNIQTGDVVATKFEKRESSELGSSLLVREIKILLEIQGSKGFPQIFFYGRDEHYNYFMLDYLGLNFQQLQKKCGGKFKILSVLHLAQQILNRIETLHSKNIIHRDIKPENFVIGNEITSLLYMIDFGLSKKFRDTNGKHILYTDKKGIIGTARYASIHAHKGKEQSRRDDLEAIGYVLVYMVKGKLPWMNIQTSDKQQKYKKIMELKISTPLEILCENLPNCFLKYFQHIASLQFQESPKYGYLKQMFSSAIEDLEEEELFQGFDWESLQEFKDKKIKQEFNNKKGTARFIQEIKLVERSPKQESMNSPQLTRNNGDISPTSSPKKVSFNGIMKKLETPEKIDKFSSLGTSRLNNYEKSLNFAQQSRSKTPTIIKSTGIGRRNSKSVTSSHPTFNNNFTSFSKKIQLIDSFTEFDNIHKIANDDDPKITIKILALTKR